MDKPGAAHEPDVGCNRSALLHKLGHEGPDANDTQFLKHLQMFPGETCTRQFLARIRSTYGYEPTGDAHVQFRKYVRDALNYQCTTQREPLPSPRMVAVL